MRHILVVDDEEVLACFAACALEEAGFTALFATSGAQALELFRSDIDLLLTDCVVPDLSGDEIATCLKARKPALHVIFMSGNQPEALEMTVPLKVGVNFLQKPFRVEDLLAIVARIMPAC